MTMSSSSFVARLFRFGAVPALAALVLFVPIRPAASQDTAQLLKEALSLMPVQRGVVIDVPTQEELSRCELKILDGNKGFEVYSPQGQLIRRFLDVRGSGQVDQRSFFRGGVEVYRDSDTTGNRKINQSRWFHSAGTRWGIDRDEDGIIDEWKQISPEEVSSEIVMALCERDANRFLRVTLKPEELNALQLGDTLREEVAAKIAKLKDGFDEAVKATALSQDVEWYQFGGSRPALVPQGRDGAKKDVLVYENGLAVIRDGSENKQIAVGSLVCLGENNWRTIDLPQLYDEATMSTTFVPAAEAGAASGVASDRGEFIKLVGDYEELLQLLAKTPLDKRAAVHDRITMQILQIIRFSSNPEDRDLWMRQLADTIMAAVQQNEYPEGVKRLAALNKTLTTGDNRDKAAREMAAYVRSRYITTEFYAQLNTGSDHVKSQVEWIENIEKFADEASDTEAGVDAMLQLASYREMAGPQADALKWYRNVVDVAEKNPALKPFADRATGSLRRIEGIGKPVPFQTKDGAGNTINVASFKGSPVLLYFWGSNAAEDLPRIAELAEKTGLKVVGINLDYDPESMKATLARTPVKWPMINATGGILDSPVAVYWGVVSTPMMILYDANGDLAAQSIPGLPELERLVNIK